MCRTVNLALKAPILRQMQKEGIRVQHICITDELSRSCSYIYI